MKVNIYASGLVTRLGTGNHHFRGRTPGRLTEHPRRASLAGHLDWTNRVSLFIMLRRAVYAAVENAPRLGSVGNLEMTRNNRWIPNGAVARVTTSASALDTTSKAPEDNGAAARRAEVRRVTVIPPRDPSNAANPSTTSRCRVPSVASLPSETATESPLLYLHPHCPRRPNVSRQSASRHGVVLYSPTSRLMWTMIGSSPAGQTPSSPLASSWCSVLPGGTRG